MSLIEDIENASQKIICLSDDPKVCSEAEQIVHSSFWPRIRAALQAAELMYADITALTRDNDTTTLSQDKFRAPNWSRREWARQTETINGRQRRQKT